MRHAVKIPSNLDQFVRNFSPLKKAELYRQSVDGKNRGLFLPEVKSILRRFYLTFFENPNDRELERCWEKGVNSTENIIKFLQNRFSDDHLRKFEYAFEAECFQRKEVSKNIIVDMGGGFSFSTIVPALFKFRNSRVISVDVIDFPRKSKYDIFYMTGNCTGTNLPSKYADTVTMISTLEHVGLGRYGDPQDPNGDIKAISEAKRILKKGGHLILTVPYGYPTVVYNVHRVYDAGRIKIIMKGFKKVRTEYTLLGKKCRRLQIEGKKVTYNIPGYYKDLSENKKILNAQGGLLGLFRKI